MRSHLALIGTGGSRGVPFADASAADLPAHRRLRILIVSDEVNPHGLPRASSPSRATSRGARAPGAGLEPRSARPTPCSRSRPTTSSRRRRALSVRAATPPPTTCSIYFAHRIPDATRHEATCAPGRVHRGGRRVPDRRRRHGLVSPRLVLRGRARRDPRPDRRDRERRRAVGHGERPERDRDVAPGHFVTDQRRRVPATRRLFRRPARRPRRHLPVLQQHARRALPVYALQPRRPATSRRCSRATTTTTGRRTCSASRIAAPPGTGSSSATSRASTSRTRSTTRTGTTSRSSRTRSSSRRIRSGRRTGARRAARTRRRTT